MEKKTLIANLIFYSFIAIVIIGLFYIVIILKSEGSQCVKNPFVYGANNNVGSKTNGAETDYSLSCTCTITPIGYGTISQFCFNKEEVKRDCSPNISGILNFNP